MELLFELEYQFLNTSNRKKCCRHYNQKFRLKGIEYHRFQSADGGAVAGMFGTGLENGQVGAPSHQNVAVGAVDVK